VTKPEKTEEEKLRSKRVHAVVMMILGAIMAVCALAAGLIALTPGAFPRWMTGAWRAQKEVERRPALVKFERWSPKALARAGSEGKLVLLHLSGPGEPDPKLMEETTYADPAVAKWVAERAVAVQADASKDPLLGKRYGVGAWPSTVLILPDGRAIASGAYLTPKLFLPWARMIDDAVRKDPSKVAVLTRFEEQRRRALADRR
jgi:hypothetical protein